MSVISMLEITARLRCVFDAVRCVKEQSEEDVTEFRRKVEDVRRKVVATGDVIKRVVDRQINHLLTKLQSVPSEIDKQVENVQEAYQLALVKVEEFCADSQELLDKGRPSDITRAGCELHDRATELLNNDFTAVKYRPPDVTFTPADVTQVKRLTLIGKLTVATDEQPGTSFTSAAFILSVITLRDVSREGLKFYP